MVRLARTDLAAVDPAVLRVAVRVPEGLRPKPGTVRLRSTIKAGSEPEQMQEYVLADVGEPAELAPLRREAVTGTAAYGFRLDAGDVRASRRCAPIF